jgi:8-oxo-dGTP pyrophosphatase MutT (NUDIX family)
MNVTYCLDKCCKIECMNYNDEITNHFKYTKFMNKKAGVCIYNSIRGSILIVQSRGKLWGFPKGTIEPGETFIECAVRELKEETNIDLNPVELVKYITIKNRSVYYIYDTLHEKGTMPTNAGTVENDVTGLSWVKINCLHNLVNQNIIKLNFHTKYILKNYLNLIIVK